MTQLFPGFGNTKHVVGAIADCICVDEMTNVVSDSLNVGSGVREVKVTWPTFQATMDGQTYVIATGSHTINAVDVASPTTYYVYFELVAGTPTIKSSTTNPITNIAVDEYFITNIVRFKSVAGVATYYISKYPTQNGVYELAHNLKEDSVYNPPQWIQGFAPTWAAGGKLSTSAGFVRFPGNEPRETDAITNGLMMLGDESGTIAGLNNITTYADGSAVTAGKYIKVLVGVNRNKGGILAAPYTVMLQGKPSVEYASQAAAKADAEGKAATGFGSEYLAAVTPLGYYVLLLGDYTTGEFVDVRSSGITSGGAGSTGITNHSLLSNLNVVADHPGYVTLDGARALTGNWNAGAKSITTSSTLSGSQLISTVAIGTKPLDVTSTTMCTNLNADSVDGIQGADVLLKDGSVTMTGALNMGSKSITAANDVGCATVTASGNAKALTLQSTQATGTAPLTVASSTVVTNLNADTVDGIQGANIVTADGLTALSGDWSAGKKITAPNFESTIATGTAPFTVASTTVVTNLNASTLQGNAASAFAVAAKGVTNGDTHDHVGGDGAQIAHSGLSGLTAPADDHTQYLLADGTRALSGNWAVGAKSITSTANLSGSQLVSTVAQGTAPLVVTSTTQVANLNAASLNGVADTGFLKADGTVQLNGNMAVTGGVTIDGVDISAHASNASAHHAPVTLSTAADTFLQLSTQEIDLDTQTATYVLAGPVSGAAAAPSFRALAVTDIPRQPSAALTLANTGNDNVAVTERKSVVYITGPTANFAVTGFIMGSGNVDGMVLRLHNGTAKTMTLTNDATSTTTNRIYSGGKTVAAGNGCTLVYNASVSRWLLAS